MVSGTDWLQTAYLYRLGGEVEIESADGELIVEMCETRMIEEVFSI